MATVSDPKTVLFWMSMFLAAVAAAAIVLIQPLGNAFLANEVFNGMILGVLMVGIVINYRQVAGLRPEARWLESYANDADLPPGSPPRLLAPMATMLALRRQKNFRLSALSMRSLLDGIRLRLDESRDVSHYLTGLLIFLGLLGTFWGLLATVASAGNVIAGMSVSSSDFASVFSEIKDDLQGPLAGMGTAFSSSLFGLAGALVLGFLDLQAGHAQNRFFNDLEEWLSKSTHLASGSGGLDGEQPLPAYIQALLEQTADSLENLQRTVARGEEDRRAGQRQLTELTEKLSALTDQLRAEQKVILGLAKNQSELQPLVARLAEAASNGWGTEEIEQNLRVIALSTSKLIEEFGNGRNELMEQLRQELRLLTRTVAALPGEKG